MIGIFDSGFGGLTLLKELVQSLPQYAYVYLGDNARAPYGNHSQEVIYEYTRQAVDFLAGQGCRLIILACNTVSAEALRQIQQQYLPGKHPDLRVLGVIRPTVEAALEQSSGKIIGIVGTQATVLSRAYEYELKKMDAQVKVFQQACPLLVPLVEEGWEGKPETNMILRKYLLPLKSCHIDTLILGCTHYPILQGQFERKMGKNVKVISSSQAAALKLTDYLQRHPEIESRLEKKREVSFFTTDNARKFEQLGSRFLGKKIPFSRIQTIRLG